ncbi:MAG: YbjQ family protein [Bacillota bacterium]|nr:YbjQ family protein [Bacillota bacterium]
MILSTVDLKTDYTVLGLVKGSTMRARHLGQDIVAGLRKIVGGEVTEYAELLVEARDESLKKMIQDAERLGANAIIGVRLQSTTITTGAAEVTAYGTAVKI